MQIYGDFSGYSDIARGVSRLMGIELMVNFRQPYLAADITEFWRCWHISLSTWLRDYLYIPLGGNRGGAVRTYRNLMLTMLLGGLWHGAAWTFVVWGGLHGLFLAADLQLRTQPGHRLLGSKTLAAFLPVQHAGREMGGGLGRGSSLAAARLGLAVLLRAAGPGELARSSAGRRRGAR